MSSIKYNFLLFNRTPPLYGFRVLVYKSKEFRLPMKENLLIIRNKSHLNQDINSVQLVLFCRAF